MLEHAADEGQRVGSVGPRTAEGHPHRLGRIVLRELEDAAEMAHGLQLLLRHEAVEERLLVREPALEGLHEHHPGVWGVLAHPFVVRGVDDRGALGLAERMPRNHFPQGGAHLQPHALRHPHPHARARGDPPHAVPRPLVRDQAIPAHLARQRVDPDVARRRERRQIRDVLGKPLDRRLVGRAMLTHIEDLSGEAQEVPADASNVVQLLPSMK